MPTEFSTGKQIHLRTSPGDLAPYVLIAGDPARVKKAVAKLDENSVVVNIAHREFVTVTGRYREVPVTIISSGIGTDNTEIVVIEASLCLRDAKHPTFIRIGSCGTIVPRIKLGDLIIAHSALPAENTSSFYLPEATRVFGTMGVITTLTRAARSLQYPFHGGTIRSTSSFYAGQFREVPGFPIREEVTADHLVPKLLQEGVLGNEMETSLLYTMGTISTIGMRAGSVCAVYAERYEGGRGFDDAPELCALGEDRCIMTGLETVRLLAEYDANYD